MKGFYHSSLNSFLVIFDVQAVTMWDNNVFIAQNVVIFMDYARVGCFLFFPCNSYLIHTLLPLTGHFNRCILLIPGWTLCTALILHGIDSTRCCKLSSEMLDHIDIRTLRSFCSFDANLPFHHILKVLSWIENRWLWRPFKYSKPSFLETR